MDNYRLKQWHANCTLKAQDLNYSEDWENSEDSENWCNNTAWRNIVWSGYCQKEKCKVISEALHLLSFTSCYFSCYFVKYDTFKDHKAFKLSLLLLPYICALLEHSKMKLILRLFESCCYVVLFFLQKMFSFMCFASIMKFYPPSGLSWD